MSETNWNSSLTIERWAKEFYREARVPDFFGPYTGESASSIIQVKTDLKKKQGDQIHFGLVEKIEGDGVTGDNTMAANEVPIVTQHQAITIDQLRQGILSTGRMEDKRTHLNFRKEAMSELKNWFNETIDKDLFTVLAASPTRSLGADNGGTLRFDASTTKSGLVAADKISLGDVTVLSKLAKVPATSGNYKIRPAMIDGKKMYLLVVGHESAVDLRKDPDWNQAQREAQNRGRSNPLFNDVLGVWGDVIIDKHENIVPFTDGGGASVRGEANLFLGAQAGMLAYGGDYSWDETPVDRGNKLAITGGIIYEAAKAKFNSIDWASIVYHCATTSLSA